MMANYCITVAFSRDPDAPDVPLVASAYDEYTADNWGGVPDFYKENIAAERALGQCVEEVQIEISESEVLALFAKRTVQETVGEK